MRAGTAGFFDVFYIGLYGALLVVYESLEVSNKRVSMFATPCKKIYTELFHPSFKSSYRAISKLNLIPGYYV